MDEEEESTCSDSFMTTEDESRIEENNWKKKRAEQLGFIPQKENIYLQHLPYAPLLDKESTEWFREIKAQLGRAVALRELEPGVLSWTNKLKKYIRHYGMNFPLDDHVLLIRLLYSVITIPDLEPFLVDQVCGALLSLLRKRDLLTGDQLTLEWRPLYGLCERFLHSKTMSLGLLTMPKSLPNSIKSVVKLSRPYFPKEATAEMMKEWRPLLCPLDVTYGKALSLMELFLPTYRAYEFPEETYHIWLDEMTGFWKASGIMSSCDNSMLALLARLAEDTIGLIEWSELLPLVFSKLKKAFNLPMKYNKTSVYNRHYGLDFFWPAIWIVSTLSPTSKTQSYLDNLFASLESYYYAANSGAHVIRLTEFMNKLTDAFCRRVRQERYKKPAWGHLTEPDARLSDDNITAFVMCVRPVALHAMWSNIGFSDATSTLQGLAYLRPELILPTLIDRVMKSVEVITEPHKYTASLYVMTYVVRPLLTSHRFYPEGRKHVLPLLFSTLPGIDPNDMKKSMITLRFISTYCAFLPIVDFSSAAQHHKLSEDDITVCMQSAQFEDFVAAFLDRCFSAIENAIVHQTRAEVSTDDMCLSREDSMCNLGMCVTLGTILSQTSEQIYMLAAKKVANFVAGRILDWKVSGRIAAGLVRSVVRIRPERALPLFLPTVCNKILAILGDHPAPDAKLDEEMRFQLVLLADIIRVPGKYLMPYMDTLYTVLDSMVLLVSKEASSLTGTILQTLLKYLSFIHPVDLKLTAHGFDLPQSNYLPLRDWGHCESVHELKLKWDLPDDRCVSACQLILDRYLVPTMDKLDAWTRGEKDLSKEELKASLRLIVDHLMGAAAFLPFWKDDPIVLKDSKVNQSQHTFVLYADGSTPEIYLSGKNVRQSVALHIHKVFHHILAVTPDDTKLLNLVASTYQTLLFYTGVSKEEYDSRSNGHKTSKNVMEGRVANCKKHNRGIMCERVLLLHDSRQSENYGKVFTKIHKLIYDDLVLLSTNYYSQVRCRGQDALRTCLSLIPYSYKMILPQLIELLRSDNNTTHQQFKGALHILLGARGRSFLTKRCWETFYQLCPALIEASHSEKPSIINVMGTLFDTVLTNMDTITIRVHVPQTVVKAALALWEAGNDDDALKSNLSPTDPPPSEEEIKSGLQHEEELNNQREGTYYRVVNKICSQLESGTLHWRHFNAGVKIVASLTRYDTQPAQAAVKAILDGLIHDSLEVRKTSIYCFGAMLKMRKRKHTLIEKLIDRAPVDATLCPGNRDDNAWMEYSPDRWPKDVESWNKPIYVHKTHWGYYQWPEHFHVYAPETEQPALHSDIASWEEPDQMIIRLFTDERKLEKLMRYLSLEENKARDRFDRRKFIMWKGLFRNYGDIFLDNVKAHLEKLTEGLNESSQRCAAELVAGLIRGSKHWTWKMTESLWKWMVPLIKSNADRITVESMGDWGTCFATSSESRDPNRLHWMMEALTEEPLRNRGSFLDTSRLYLLQGAITQQEWRIGSLLNRLMDNFKPFLNHPYFNVRERLASVLTNMHALDYDFPAGPGGTSSPRVSDFIRYVLPRLEILLQEPDPELYNYQRSSKEADRVDPAMNNLHMPIPLTMQPGAINGVSLPQDNIPPPDALAGMLPPDPMRQQEVVAQNATNGQKLSVPPTQGKPNHPDMPGSAHAEVEYGNVENTSAAMPSADKSHLDPGMRNKWEERQNSVHLLQTTCKFISGMLLYNNFAVKPEVFDLLKVLCMNESSELEPELAKDCNVALSHMSGSVLTPGVLPVAVERVCEVAKGQSWKCRLAALNFLLVMVSYNTSVFLEQPHLMTKIIDEVLRLLSDQSPEVRKKAGHVLSGLLHTGFIKPEQKEELIKVFTQSAKKKIPRRNKEAQESAERQAKISEAIIKRHSGVLGLSAVIQASPYDIPNEVPGVLMILSDHLNDPQPIDATVKHVLQDFKRTHQDNWIEHKEKFTEDQLSVLTDLLVSPSYYA